MKRNLSFEARVRGCLIGAAAGAELGVARAVRPERFAAKEAKDVPGIALRPTGRFKPATNRIVGCSARPFIDVAIRAYLKKRGRVTPEDFAALFQDDPGIAAPAFALDNFHNVQELLKEGMHPRISGLGNAPCGLMAACMPAVGLFHFSDPERAYLDGVEIASVAQPRLGADWAALCAAAIAAAFTPGATAESVVAGTLRIAHQNNKDLFYALNGPVRTAQWLASQNDDAFIDWWLRTGAKIGSDRTRNWIAYNPLQYVLPLLPRLAARPDLFFKVALAPNVEGFTQWMLGGHAISAVVGGAVIGALNGPDAFPPELREWAERLARPWFGMAGVLTARAKQEAAIIAVIQKAGATKPPTRGAQTPPLRDILRDKIYGNILAGAIGNAMGSPMEGRFYWEVDKEHPRGVRTILDPSRLESEDDNQMAMLLTETYLQRGGAPAMARHFGKTWQERLNRDHFYPLCMGNAYDLICQGWDPRVVGHWSVVTGSTVMCMEPVGIYNIADPEWAFIDAVAVSYMYQRGLDLLAAANLAATVAEALRPEATVDSVCQAAIDTAPSGPLKTFDKRKFRTFRDYIRACLDVADKYTDVMAVRKELYDKCLLYHHIDPLELWGFALAMFKVANGDVRQAAIGGTNIGRDADTIAGRAAMLAGTLRGGRNVPQDWVRMVKTESLSRIKTNAGRFADLLVNQKIPMLQRRVSVAGMRTA